MTTTTNTNQQTRHQGRILHLHYTCSAPLPYGTTLRVTTQTRPPPENDVPDGNLNQLLGDDTASVASSNSGSGLIHDYYDTTGGIPTSTSSKIDVSGDVKSGEMNRLHNRLLQNTVEMFTTPETYPIWKTKRPVVVIDEGGDIGTDNTSGDGTSEAGGGGKMVHNYRYVAVTPGALIDWSLCTRKELGDHDSGKYLFIYDICG